VRAMAQEAGRDPAEIEIIVRANIEVSAEPRAADGFAFTGTPDQIKADIAETRDLGAAELHFDPTFSPDGATVEGFLSRMEQMKELAGA
ncbi:MAG: hypothetical protein IIB22_10775, partial [Chloroflexi bacterium]|nr:hypothetical protein [Chloroflexota bacterium]